MDEEIVVKIKEKEILEVIKYIAIFYLIFLFFYALILDYEETIIQASFIVVFAVIIDLLNLGELVISESGIRTKALGFVKFSKIYRIKFDKRLLTIYVRDKAKPYRIYISKREDYRLVERAIRFIEAKIKKIEDDSKEHEEYINNYL